MDNKTLKQLILEAKKQNLSSGEKIQIFQELRVFMAENPTVRNLHEERHHLQRSIWSSFNPFNLNYKPMPIILAVLLVLGGGASVAAENSVPGDALYPVKLNVNEQVRSWVSLNPEAKAQWEVILAERRLTEAEELAAEGRLNAEVRAQIESRFQAHADKVETKIEALKEKDPEAAAEIASHLETSLKVHEKILISIGLSKEGMTEAQAQALAEVIKSKSKVNSETRAEVEAKLSNLPGIQASAEGKLEASENKIAEVRKFVDNNRDRFEAEAVAQAEARLKLANDLVIQGKAKLEAEAYGEAFVLFSKAHRTAQEAKLLLSAKAEFENKTENRDGNSSGELKTNARVESETEVDSEEDSVKPSGKVEIDFDLD